MSNSTKKILVLVLSVCALFLLLCVVLLFLGTSYGSVRRNENFTQNLSNPKRLRSRSYSEDGTSSFGFVDLFTEKKSIFYQNEDDEGKVTYTLLSSFDTTEFKCTGSCHCETERKSATSVSLVRNGLIFLVGAVSSYLAYEKASDYFQDECEKVLKDDCYPSSAIMSQTYVCSSLGSDEERGYTDGIEIKESTNQKKYDFMCSGNCVPISMEDFEYHFEFLKTFDTEGTQSDFSEIGAEIKKMIPEVECQFMVMNMVEISGSPSKRIALFDFSQQLFHFCLEKSKRQLMTEKGYSPKGGVPFCEAWDGVTARHQTFKVERNPTVECVEVMKSFESDHPVQ